MTLSLPELRLNPALDPHAFAEQYARDRFVQVSDILEPHLAEALETLLKSLPWRLVYADPKEGVVQLSQAELQQMGQQGVAQRMAHVMELATRNYGYCYNAYQMNEAADEGRDLAHPIHRLTVFLNGGEFRSFVSTVIGEAGLTRTDAQATLYTRGSFLTRHIDDGSKNERRCAYTLGFTRDWMTDWGGLLMFLDGKTDVSSGFLPRFNVLTLFDGRKIHAVSPVSAFAGHPRLSVAGWLRND